MKDNKLFKGIYSAIFSVYDKELNVKRDTVEKLVEYQLQNGLKGFYVGGNTGECTVLPAKTRIQMTDAVIEANRGRGQVMGHVGAGHINEVYELIEDSNAKKVDAIASLPPSLQSYYNFEEIIEYYKIIAKRSKHPVYAYITSFTKGDFVSFAEKIMKIDNIYGLKISVPDYFNFGSITQLNGGNINVLNGPDETLLCGLSEGADGAIGTSYNILPALAVKIYNLFGEGKIPQAREAQNQLNSVIKIVLGCSLAYWKGIMTLMGFDMGYTVEPQKLPSKEDLAKLKEKLSETGLFNFN